jgi:hypothetical protein
VPSWPTPFLHYPGSPFDRRYVLICMCQVYHGSTWNRLNQGLWGCKYTAGMHYRDMETTLKIVLIHFFKSLEYLRYREVREVVGSRETDLTNKHQEERNLVDEEDVGYQEKPHCGDLVTPSVLLHSP